MGDLLADRALMHPVAVQYLATAGFSATNAAATAAASLLFRLTVARWGARPLRRAGLPTSTAGAAVTPLTGVAAVSHLRRRHG